MGYPFYLAAYHLKVVPHGPLSAFVAGKSPNLGISTGSFSAMRRPEGTPQISTTLVLMVAEAQCFCPETGRKPPEIASRISANFSVCGSYRSSKNRNRR